MSVVHASVELLDAMWGTSPLLNESDRGGHNGRWHQPASLMACTGGPSRGRLAWAAVLLAGKEGISECSRVVTCADCIALYPPEIRVRMDHVAERDALVPLRIGCGEDARTIHLKRGDAEEIRRWSTGCAGRLRPIQTLVDKGQLSKDDGFELWRGGETREEDDYGSDEILEEVSR